MGVCFIVKLLKEKHVDLHRHVVVSFSGGFVSHLWKFASVFLCLLNCFCSFNHLAWKKIGSASFANLFILMAHSTKKKVCHWSCFWIDPAGDSWQEMLYPKLLWRTSVICWQEFWQFSRTNPISSSFSFSATTFQFLYIPCSFRSSSSILQFIKPLCSFIRYSFTFLCISVFLHIMMHLLICI